MSRRDALAARAAARLGPALLRGGLPGRVLGPLADLSCAAGPRRAVRELRADLRGVAREQGGDPSVYEPIWREAAEALGAELHACGSGFLELRDAGVATRVWRNLVPLDDPVTLRLAGDKPAVHRRLLAAGLPSPPFASFERADLAPARRFLHEHGAPCVVKPAFGTGRGRGVTCGVRTLADLRRAVVWASRWSGRMLIERQGHGDEYRALVLDGEVLDVVRRRPPSVIGDGRSRIGELIDAENARRAAAAGASGLFALGVNLDCLLALRDGGLTLRSVPAAGTRVVVKHAANENGPEDNRSVLGAAGARFLADVSAAAGALGARLVSVEVVAPRIDEAIGATDGVVVELNTTPGLHYHYQVANRAEAVPVAVPILRTLLSDAAAAGDA